jgi:hypothetical protein
MCDNCRQLETHIKRATGSFWNKVLILLTIEIQRYRKLLALGLDPLTIERTQRVIQKLVQHKPAYALTANRLGTSSGFSSRRGRKATGLLARVTH